MKGAGTKTRYPPFEIEPFIKRVSNAQELSTLALGNDRIDARRLSIHRVLSIPPNHCTKALTDPSKHLTTNPINPLIRCTKASAK
ncbi:hypothetical protein BGS_0787 [Beggiatoa sp. SS]|nr:hypothetical protein BGS_0787 [Beggiatoa sp. SS]